MARLRTVLQFHAPAANLTHDTTTCLGLLRTFDARQPVGKPVERSELPGAGGQPGHRLAAAVKGEMPLLLLADFCASGDIRSAVALIKADAATSHIPIIAFAPDNEPAVLEGAGQAGADFTVVESAAGAHLPQLIDQALHIE